MLIFALSRNAPTPVVASSAIRGRFAAGAGAGALVGAVVASSRNNGRSAGKNRGMASLAELSSARANPATASTATAAAPATPFQSSISTPCLIRQKMGTFQDLAHNPHAR